MSWVLTAIGVHSLHFTVVSRIVIVAVTANHAFLFLVSLFPSWLGKVQKKNERNLSSYSEFTTEG